jgi:hypothetical protein
MCGDYIIKSPHQMRRLWTPTTAYGLRASGSGGLSGLTGIARRAPGARYLRCQRAGIAAHVRRPERSTDALLSRQRSDIESTTVTTGAGGVACISSRQSRISAWRRGSSGPLNASMRWANSRTWRYGTPGAHPEHAPPVPAAGVRGAHRVCGEPRRPQRALPRCCRAQEHRR